MTKIRVIFHAQTKTYVADDGFGNQITFKSDRETNEAIPVSSSTTLGPMISLLMACGACSAIDIVMILEKQRQLFDELIVEVTGEREQNQTPALWKSVQIDYILKGNLDAQKVQKAAELSVEKYCSVLETLRRAGAKVTFNVTLNS